MVYRRDATIVNDLDANHAKNNKIEYVNIELRLVISEHIDSVTNSG